MLSTVQSELLVKVLNRADEDEKDVDEEDDLLKDDDDEDLLDDEDEASEEIA